MDGTGSGSGFVVDWCWMVVDGSGLRKKYRKLQHFVPYKTSGYAWIETGYAWMVVDCALFSGFCQIKMAQKPTFSLFLVTVKK